MSGSKCSNVSISSTEYNRLRNDTRRADKAAAVAGKRAREERRRNEQLQAEFKLEQARMEQNFQHGLAGVSQEIRNAEILQTRRLDKLRGEMVANFEAHRSAFSRALQDHRQEVAAALHAIRDEIKTDKERQRSHASAMVADVETLLDLLGANDAHERFAPGELTILRGRIGDARRMLEQGQFQAALGQAQERYYAYQELRVKIAEREAEWSARLELVLRQSEKIAGEIAAAEQARYTFGEIEKVEIAAEIEFWSEGHLSALIDRYRAIAAQLSEPKNCSIDDLEASAEAMTAMEGGIAQIIDNARDRLVQSQVRQNIGEAVVASFQGTIWTLDDNAYEQEDLRRGFHIKMKNIAGEEIVASILPKETADGTLTSTVEINFFDSGNDERLRAARLNEMQRAMQAQGVEVGRFECLDNSEGRPGNQIRRDFQRLRQPQELRAGTERLRTPQ